jgi:putative ABC transport system ATP-binding protein/lipoprotein-releasing system ATP-binding protein
MRLNACNVWFRYKTRTILKGIDLSVAVGESVAILGPSGVGKTTLLSLLGGMQKPESGAIDVDGDSDTSRWVAWTLQTANVLPYRTALDNTALGALADGRNRREAILIAHKCLRDVGLSSVVGETTRRLSGGELQRVVIARGLASTRPFLLADEPTGQLDRATTDLVAECLLATKTDRGVVIVTHDVTVAERCDRVYRLIDGQLSYQDMRPDGSVVR